MTANFGDEQLGDVASEYRRFGEAFDDFRRARRAEHLAEDGEHFDEMAFFRFAIVRRHVVVFDEETSKVNRACKRKETKETSFCFFFVSRREVDYRTDRERPSVGDPATKCRFGHSPIVDRREGLKSNSREGELVNERRVRLRKVTAGVKKVHYCIIVRLFFTVQRLSYLWSLARAEPTC